MSIEDQNAYIAATRHILSNIKTGQKLWFWFCGAHLNQSLYLSELSEDPKMEALSSRIKSTNAPTGVNQYVGLMSVKQDGQIDLISQKATATMLYEVAGFVRGQLEAIPELATFRNSVMVEANGEGLIVNQYADPGAWKGVRSFPVMGTTQHAVSTLKALSTGQTAWFALGQDSSGLRLLVSPTETDTTGEGFAALVKRTELQSNGPLMGTVLRGADRLIFTCSKGNGDEQNLFSSLVAQYGASSKLLQSLKLFRIKGTKKKEIAMSLRNSAATPTGKPSELAQRLSALNGEARLFFYYTDNGLGKTPNLLVSSDKDDLKSKAKALMAGSRVLRGTCAMSPKGFILFQSTGSIEAFVPALAAWVKAQPNPSHYKVLFGARFIHKTAEGVIAKEKDDAAWVAIQ